MRVRLLSAAADELDAALRWYASRAPALAKRFLDDLRAARQRIARSPEAWRLLHQSGVRRCQLRRFPYGLIYVVEADEIIVIAVAHLHRRPGYWRGRR